MVSSSSSRVYLMGYRMWMQCSIIPANHLDSRLLTSGNNLVLSCNCKWMYFALLYQNTNVVSVSTPMDQKEFSNRILYHTMPFRYWIMLAVTLCGNTK